MTSDQLVWTFEKTVPIPVSDIEKILFDIRQGSFQTGNLPFLLRDKSDCKIELVNSTYMVVFNDGHKEYITPDAVGHQLTIKGEWWYKGVYSFEKEGVGTRIQLNVFNAAQRYRWVASLMMLSDKRCMQVILRYL